MLIRSFPWRWALFAFILVGMSVLTGSLAGYRSGTKARQAWGVDEGRRALAEQFQLGAEDLASGRYDLARQRFEWVINRDPAYPGAAEGLAQAMTILFATATPTALPPTITLTPTRDLRPVQDLFAQAQLAWAAGDWTAAIETLSALRKEDPNYQTPQVDGMFYISLRNRGIQKILEESNLEGGIYDLALAERFGPLDARSNIVREWARLYLYGSSFWEAVPEQALYYFGQVAAAAPGLRDASGWTAAARYRESLVHYADWLARSGDWCAAQVQYDAAVSAGASGVGDLQATAVWAAEQCAPPTETVVTITPTLTPTMTTTSTPSATWPAATTQVVESETPTATPPFPTDTPTPPVETTPPPVTEIPTEIPPVTTEPPPTETPTTEPTAVAPATQAVEVTQPMEVATEMPATPGTDPATGP